jgi:hypothetical protein
MATGSRGTEFSDLHMIVLGTIRRHGAAHAEEIAAWLKFPVALIEAQGDELEAAGRLTLVRGH